MALSSSAVNRFLRNTVLPIALVAAAVRLELWLAHSSHVRLLFFAFSPAVALSALLGGFRGGAIALALSVVGSDYYLLGPGKLFNVEGAAEALALAAFVIAWLPMTVLAERMHRARRRQDDQRLLATRAAAQADRLEQLTAALAKGVSPQAAIEACVQEAAHWLGAPAASFFVGTEDGEWFELARAIGYPDEYDSSNARIRADAKGPVQDAARRRAAVILETTGDRHGEYDNLQSEQQPHHGALVALPLLAATGLLAVLRLDFAESRHFDTDDRDFLAQLTSRGAQALDRARQYEVAQRARAEAERLRLRADEELQERLKIEQALRTSETRYRALAARTSRLHALTAALSEASTVDAVARAVVTRGRTAVGATAAEVATLVEQGAYLELLATDPWSDTTARIPVSDGFCATDALQTHAPVFVPSFDELQQRYWQSATAAADGGYVSSAVLPLLRERTAIGVLAFHFMAPVNFDEEYQALLVSVAQHCAQALDRARLYESAQHARDEAEAANRLKDDFLSVVSHDLRTPLTSILGWTTILQKPSIEAGLAARAHQAIRDNAERQARLIEDLLDFSRIAAGRLVLEKKPVSLHTLLRGVIEAVLPTAAASRVELRYGDIPALTVIGDPRRLEQVFFNLLGNALKFTPDGGIVELHARIVKQVVEVSVSDTGAGIEPEFVPHVFERFRQDQTNSTRAHQGVGLGLSIAKELVEGHGGSITVRSEGRGRGATFTVTLPLAAAPVPQQEVPAPAESEQAQL
jgi:K+-sensing histidine kinase KdpD